MFQFCEKNILLSFNSADLKNPISTPQNFCTAVLYAIKYKLSSMTDWRYSRQRATTEMKKIKKLNQM